jgi:cell division protein FtsL
MNKRFFLYLSLIILFALIIFASVWQDIQVTTYGYQIGELEKEKRCLQKEQKFYRLRIAKLLSPKRIEKIASERLGLITPKKLEIIALTINDFNK